MLRTLVVLFLLGLCGFYVYQKQQVESPAAATAPRVVDDSALRELKKSLPAVIFEKDVLPTIERNQKGGLTEEDIDNLLDRLDTIGRALGGKVSDAVEQAARTVDPEAFSQKSLAQRTADAALEGAQNALPVLQELAADLIRGLAAALSFLLDQAADLIQGK